MNRFRSLESPIVNRLFLFFVCGTVCAVVLRYCFFDAKDPSKCGALLNEGIWLDAAPANTTVPSQWQPPGCMVHKYKPTEISTCLADRRVVFAGDSTIRQLFWGVAKRLDDTVDPTKTEKHTNIQLEMSGVKLEFIWDPYLNESQVQTELSVFNGVTVEGSASKAALLVMGSGLWYARHENVIGRKKWKDAIDNVVEHMPSGRPTTDMTNQDLVLLSPVPVPAWAKLNDDRKKTIIPSEVSYMNGYLQQLSDWQGINVIWSFNQMSKGQPQTFEDSGIHLLDSITAKQVDVLLNLRCNAVLPSKYPYDKTCCNKYDPPNTVQWFGLVYVLAILPVMAYLRNRDTSGVKQPGWLPSERMIHAMLVFGLAVVYCFYADRTQVFNKSHKHFEINGFLLLCFITGVLGYLTIRKSSETATDQPFLFRDQTDEWKGWMQYAILIYHYTGASKVAWIYGFIRITVASYLFMTGYGHTVFFIKKGDYSFKRVAGVLIRLNLLSCALPYIMKTEYIFYYFAPLTSFWFLVVYITMRIGAKYNSNTSFLMAKIVCSAILVTALTKLPGVLETIFDIPHILAKIEWNVTEWRFRVFLDMWIVYVGMVVAVLFVRFSDNTSAAAASLPTYRRYAIIASCVALPLFFLFQTTRENKFVYNAYHPYLSWVPILSFIVLRNATPRLRNSYSSAFAWLGKCSLETFTLQFHIWLAADTQGLLDLGIFGAYHRFANFVIATIVFFYVSHALAGATGDLTAWIMGAEKKPAARPVAPSSLPTTTRDVQPESSSQAANKAPAADSIPLNNFSEPAAGSSAAVASAAGQQRGGSSGKVSTYWKNLKLRCAILLVAMWVLNLTYPS